jgi:hypothetical protein
MMDTLTLVPLQQNFDFRAVVLAFFKRRMIPADANPDPQFVTN